MPKTSGTAAKKSNNLTRLDKTPSGIPGLDEITYGGLPKGRTSLICGEAGCGKTLFALEFIIQGALKFNDPGVFMAFEEKADELAVNIASLGFDLPALQRQNKVRVDHVRVERSEIEETGEYDMEGLFIRLGHAIDTIGAKRVVLDTIENLFAGFSNDAVLRSELRRLFGWLRDKGVTALVTGERGVQTLTRQGLEEYVSDCVILLDHRVINEISTRRLRVVKYRGSVHGTNEYPFLIDEEGISVLPITSLVLDKPVSAEVVSTGIPALDKMLGKSGFFRGSSILVSGSAGTGKTSIAATFAHECCRNNERCLFFAFEESPQQVVRNMQSIGINLKRHLKKGLLKFYASRPTIYGLEMHLVAISKAIRQFKPSLVVIDPISNFITIGNMNEVRAMLVRLIDYLQMEHITVMFTSLSLNNGITEHIDDGVSSLVDAWILVRDFEMNGERNKGLYVIKSRGMNHSKQIREFIISDKGLTLIDVYRRREGVFTGTAREEHAAMEKQKTSKRNQQ